MATLSVNEALAILGRGENVDIKTVDETREMLAALDKRLSGKMDKHRRAMALLLRAILYNALGDEKMLQAAREAFAVTKSSMAHFVLGVALYFSGHKKESFPHYKEAYRLPHSPKITEIALSYAMVLLYEGRWTEAWPIFLESRQRMVKVMRLPEWLGQSTPVVSVIPEGGMGDLIQFSRFLPLFSQRGIRAVSYNDKSFYSAGFRELLARQPWFPEQQEVFRGELLNVPSNIPAVGWFDLMAALGITDKNIPDYPAPFVADPERVEHFQFLRNDSRPTVGICYRAYAMETPFAQRGSYRALQDDQMMRLVEATRERINWVNLQYQTLPPAGALRIPEINSWEDTAGIIANMDAVVSVDTSVMHLAAAMNKPTWTLLSGASEWKFGVEGSQSIWYKTMRLFRNNAFGFNNAVDAVIPALNDYEFLQEAPHGELNIQTR